MKGEGRYIFKVACIYMATIIGAGFASGREILQFFSNYYKGGFFGIVFAGILFAFIGGIVLNKVYCERIGNYDEFLFPMVGWFIGWIIEIMISLFMISVFCIMIAGSGRIIADHLHISYSIATVLTSFICMLLILTSIRGVVAMSAVITPILIVGMLAVGFYMISTKDTSVLQGMGIFQKATHNWFFSALLYVSYNSLSSVVVMTGLLPYLKTKRIAILGGTLGGLMLCFVAFVLNLMIYLFFPVAVKSELPVLGILAQKSGILTVAYSFILWLAMFTSAVTSGYCAVERISSKLPFNTKNIAIVVCALAVPLSSVGFSGLISVIYPVFGYLGLFLVFMILVQGFYMRPSMGKRRSNK